MNPQRLARRALHLSWAGALLAGAAAVSAAPPPGRSVRTVPQPAAPAGIPPGGLPNPSGLVSPLPSPGGLNSQFPAGLPALPDAAGLPSPGAPSPPSIEPGSLPLYPGGTHGSAMGGAAYGGTVVAPAAGGADSGPYTALQIAQSFLAADTNRDGELTRAEAQRLVIIPRSFEDMDENKDGVVSRSEYENAFGH